MDDVRSAKSADRDAGFGCDCDWEGRGVGGQRARDVFERGGAGAGFIASRGGRHLIRGVIMAVRDAASEGGR